MKSVPLAIWTNKVLLEACAYANHPELMTRSLRVNTWKTNFNEPVETPPEHVIKVRSLICQIISYAILLVKVISHDIVHTFSEIRCTPTY